MVVLSVPVGTGSRERRSLDPVDPTTPVAASVPPGHVPRVARMLALKIHWSGLIRAGIARDQAALARLGGVSRARVTQVMDLFHLAPGIQEEILSLREVAAGRDRVRHRDVVRIAAEPLWSKQRPARAALNSRSTEKGQGP